MAGSPFEQDYLRLAPDPGDWPTLIEKTKALDRTVEDWPDETTHGLRAPVLVVVGDSDIIRPDHAVELFQLLGGGVAGDLGTMPDSQPAILPGTTHIGVVHRADWLASMAESFLSAPSR
jgi:pimeloyl-ACP methyl ester carboxylesterase